MRERWFVFALIVFLFLGQAWASFPTTYLVDYYNFEQTSGNLLDQKGSFDGTNTSVTQTSSGKIGNAYTYLTGATDSTVLTGLNAPIDKGTWSMWIYPTENCNGQTCFLYGTNEGSVGELQIMVANGTLAVGVGGGWQETCYDSLNLNQWNLIQITWAGRYQILTKKDYNGKYYELWMQKKARSY